MRLSISIVVSGLVGAGCTWISQHFLGEAKVADFFWEVKSEMFSGLFTVSGLLLTLKTYIVVKLHEEIYSKPSYIAKYVEMAETNKTKDDCHLDPLCRLSDALTAAVAYSACAAIVVILAAAVGGKWGSLIGYSASASAIGSLAFCWFRIKDNLKKYFDHLKAEAKAKTDAARIEFRKSAENPPSFDEIAKEIEARHSGKGPR